MNYGRKEIWTDVPEITSDNIISVLQQAMIDFTQNAQDCEFLLNYEKGMQEKTRVKTYRSDIDNWCVDNIANEIVEFKLGFNWGNPITLVQRGDKDSGTKEEAEAIALINECYDAEEIKKKTQELARFVEICGIGFTIVEVNTEWEEGDSYFKVNVLDPRCAFVIKSSYYVDHRPMLGASFRFDNKGNFYFTCFSKDRRYEILNATRIIKNGKETEIDEWSEKDEYIKKNYLGRIPITEYIRSHDRMGCFERQIPEMNNLNLLISDFTNDVEQNTMAVWHTNDVDFPKIEITDSQGNTTETTVTPESNEWLQTYTSQDGKTPIVEPLSINYDYSGMLNNIQVARARILQKCDVPQRNDNSGGSTGTAMDSATGYSDAETAAQKEQNIIEGCKMEEVKSVLAAIRESDDVPINSPLRNLKYIRIQPNFKRNKNFELTTKINGICALIGKGFALEDCLNMVPIAEDPSQVIARSGAGVKAYQDANVFKTETIDVEEEKRPFGDESDQIANSPLIDGMTTG